ncbi:TetR/AcrR family transcriptional regulator [Mesonia maritima]|uniref:AcrR family transcriptional regulator n=1 Tax=Mesonia maritima TaxID=1793873 RepID=A0ABU1K427_9FLAO|nr:TetR/AcrR family transcriptional regulator [Mesonia maritima]MDR6300374.1 AcrR family transcriptional regulator [Mesonia maritima]
MLANLTLLIPENIYKKDPQSSKLGRRILEHSILYISKNGLECLTFKKLASEIKSNESSIYRYFENKHMLMLYLISWYWGWLEHKLIIRTANIEDDKEVLVRAIKAITETPKKDESFGFINEEELHYIIVQEYSKAFQTKEVDEENKNGYFTIYKRLIEHLAELITNYNPSYKYPLTLANTILQGTLKQHFLYQHFPQLSDFNKSNEKEPISNFFLNLIFNK